MRAAWLLLLALGLPACPWGCRCLRGAPPVLPPTSSRNETLGGDGRPRAPDVVVLAAVGGWLSAILVYVGRYVRRSRAETRLHLEYLRALPCKPPSPKEEEEGEEETLSTVLLGAVGTSHHQQQTGEPRGREAPPRPAPAAGVGSPPAIFDMEKQHWSPRNTHRPMGLRELAPHKTFSPPGTRKEQGMEKVRGKRASFNLYSTSPVSCETLRRY
ncbi:uncharacterized protein ACIBXB_021131 [Morphnus guianensis]